MKKILLWYFKRNLQYVDGMFVYTEAAGEFLSKHVPDANVTLIEAPTNTNVFKLNPEKEFLPGGQLRLLMNARYSAYKRHKDLFEAIDRLRENGRDVRLTCISREEKGKDEVVSLAKAMGVQDIVDFHDPVGPDEVGKLYWQHDVLVLPSYNEAIGMVVPEAMACGIPTITTDTIGANTYVSDMETGFIYPTGDIDALVATLEGCFDAQRMQDMGMQGYERVTNLFSPDAIADRFLKRISQ